MSTVCEISGLRFRLLGAGFLTLEGASPDVSVPGRKILVYATLHSRGCRTISIGTGNNPARASSFLSEYSLQSN